MDPKTHTLTQSGIELLSKCLKLSFVPLVLSAVFILSFSLSAQKDDIREGERDGSVHQGGRARAGRQEIQRHDTLSGLSSTCPSLSSSLFPLTLPDFISLLLSVVKYILSVSMNINLIYRLLLLSAVFSSQPPEILKNITLLREKQPLPLFTSNNAQNLYLSRQSSLSLLLEWSSGHSCFRIKSRNVGLDLLTACWLSITRIWFAASNKELNANIFQD